MSENLFGLTVAADKGLDDLQCQRLLSENRKYQEVMLQYRCALKALESRLEILNEEFSLQHDLLIFAVLTQKPLALQVIQAFICRNRQAK